MKLSAEQVAVRQAAEKKLDVLVRQQSEAGWAIREIVSDLRSQGVGWKPLAEMLGMNPSTLRYQFLHGSLIVAVEHYRRGESA